MARYCSACGRPLDRKHHDVAGDEHGKHLIADRKHGTRKATAWVCKVRRLADHTALDLATGERKTTATYIPIGDIQQRTAANNLRSVPIAILNARKAAGG